jgi:hypothetical protein
VYEVSKARGEYTLKTTIYSGTESEWGSIAKEDTRTLTSDEVTSLTRIFDNLDLERLEKSDNYQGLDGSTWELEFPGHSRKKISRWTPIDNAEDRGLVYYVKLGILLWDISGMDEPEENFY